jgi:hypothetical protein
LRDSVVAQAEFLDSCPGLHVLRLHVVEGMLRARKCQAQLTAKCAYATLSAGVDER